MLGRHTEDTREIVGHTARHRDDRMRSRIVTTGEKHEEASVTTAFTGMAPSTRR
jgi:hypothetical protein